MKKGDINVEKGFTVIEVALTLGIAGLIFLMVFIALPGLQRTQKDAQRREAVTKLIDAIKKYQSNSRGTLPSGTGTYRYQSNITSANKATWLGFYNGYLGSDYIDPDGSAYLLKVVKCGDGVSDNRECISSAQYTNVSFPNNHQMLVVLNAQCSGDRTVKSENPRMAAVLYRLEGAGVYCSNT